MIRGQGGVSGKTGSGGFKSGSGMEANYACRLLSNLNALRQDSSGFNLCDVEIVAGLDQVKIIKYPKSHATPLAYRFQINTV